MAGTHPQIAIIGTGMAGLGAAAWLRSEGYSPVMYDKHAYPGGHTASHTIDGFIFDEGPHVSFTKHERIRDLLIANVEGRYERIHAKIDNYWTGHWIKHPVITNLQGLPDQLIVRIIADFVAAKALLPETISNYEEWLVAGYGRAYAETFPMQYTRKYHTTDASNMSTEWVGPRLYEARLEELLLGALVPDPPNIHYVQEYRYPKQNGFAEFLRPLHAQSTMQLNHDLVSVNPKEREIRFSNGFRRPYDCLISSVPLPDLIPMIEGAPKDVLDAAARLACTTLVLVNLGVARTDISASSWTYFYDDEFPFSRVSFPRNMSSHTVPEGTASIQAEIYFSSKYKPLTTPAEAWIAPTIAGLQRCGLLREEDRILVRQVQQVDYANIIFDLDRAQALAVVHGFLDDIGIHYCGRYGEWGYLWTDEAFLSGERAATGALERCGA